jgi:hypothetical protein
MPDSAANSVTLEELREHWHARFDSPDEAQIAAEREALIAETANRRSSDQATQFRINLAIREYLAKRFREDSRSTEEVEEALARARKGAPGDSRLEFAQGLVAVRRGDLDAAVARFQSAADGGLVPAAYAWLIVHHEIGPADADRTLKGLRRMVLLLCGEDARLPAVAKRHFARESGGYRQCLAACRKSNELDEGLTGIDELVASRWNADLVAAWTLGRERMESRRQRLVQLQENNPESLAKVVQGHLVELNAALNEADERKDDLNESKAGQETADRQLLASIRKDQAQAKSLVRQGAQLRQEHRALSIPRKSAQRQVGTRRVRRELKQSRSEKRRYYEYVDEPIYEWYEPDDARNERLRLLSQVEMRLREAESAHAAVVQTLRASVQQRKLWQLETKRDGHEYREQLDKHSQLKERIDLLTIHAPSKDNIEHWLHDPGYWVRFDAAEWKDRLMSVLK